MNNIIKRILICAAAVAAILSCTSKDDSQPLPVYLEVNANNISGNWQLVEWKGEELNEMTYMYIQFVRNDKTFRMWANMDSFTDVPHYSTGEFSISTDEEYGALIQGKYDYQAGFWSHEYVVNDLTEDSMIWVAKDDPQFIQKFVRVDSIPYDEGADE